MQYDYYAFQKERLGNGLSELEQALREFKETKEQEDKKKIEQAAKKLVQIEPHLAYLWYEAQGRELKNPIRDAWQKDLKPGILPDAFHFTPDFSALNYLPSFSFMLRVPFKLRKPYLSKDDHIFYLLDNPIRKDKVFQTPMIGSTSWKGVFQSTLWQMGYKKEDEEIIRLFGEAREDETGRAGCLYFYPTFFKELDKLGLEVINPHDRKTGTGKNPILIECVPANATGEFILLYVPFGSPKPDEVAADLQLIAEGIEKMLTVYGFGAKTSSGFGIAKLNGRGELAIRADLPEFQLPHYLIAPGQLHPDFKTSDGSLKLEAEYLKGKSGKKEKQLYDEAKKWWEREGRQIASAIIPKPVIESTLPCPKTSVTQVSFITWGELCDRTQEMIDLLCKGG